MFCENCGSQMNDTDKFCINCGWKVPEDEVPVNAEGITEENVVSTEGTPEENTVNTEGTPEENTVSTEGTPEEIVNAEGITASTEVAPEQMAEEAVVNPEDTVNETFVQQEEKQPEAFVGGGYVQNPQNTAFEQPKNDVPGKKPGNKALFIVLAVVAAVAVIAGIVVCNLGAITNTFMKTFSSPEKYYQYVEKKEIAELAGSAASIYDNVILSNANFSDRSVESKFTLEIGDEALDKLEDFTDVQYDLDDLDWLKEITLTVNSNSKDNLTSGEASLSLGKTEIISGEVIYNVEKEDLYIQVPQLIEKYIGIEDVGQTLGTSYYRSADTEEVLAMMEKVYDKCPDKGTVEKLLYKYFCTALECIDDVEKERTELEAEDITQKCTQLKATIDFETSQKMAVAVLEQMKDDKELKKIIMDMAEIEEDVDAKELYEDFQNSIENEIENVDYWYDSHTKIVMSIYIDGKGNVIGRQIKVRGDGEQMTLNYKMPQKGGKFGFELSLDADGDNMRLVGTGKKSGNKLNGEFTVKEGKNKLLEIEVSNYDTKKIKEGFIEGNFIFSIKGAGTSYSTAAAMLSSYKLGFDIKTTKSSSNVVTTLYDGDEVWATLTTNVKTEKGKKVTVPADKKVIVVEDEYDLEEILEDIKFDKLKSNLKKAKAPSELLDMIEYLEDELEYMLY